MTNGAKPDRADVCIIGAGASGATAAKVLTERGCGLSCPGARPVADTRNVQRRRARQRPSLQPVAGPAAQSAHRSRASADEIRGAAVLPGAADGWRRDGPLDRLAAAHDRERVQTAQRSTATCPGRTWPTGRSPTRSSSRTTTRSNGRSVSPVGQAPTNMKGPRSRGYPCPPLPPTRGTPRSSTRAAPNSATTPSRLRPRPCRGPTTAGRPRTRAPSPSSTAIRPGPGPTR